MVAPLPISVVIVASNESRNLPRCLRSVAGWTDESVVVLNNTTDDSEAVATALGARVVHRPWEGFRGTKNAALALARNNWVLSLDADEEVSPALRDEIAGFFNSGAATRHAGADFPRKSWFMGRWIRHGDWYPDRCLRLLRRDQGRWGGDEAHTHIVLDGPMARMRADLHHYSYGSLPEQVWKISRQSDDFVRNETARGRRWSLVHALFRPFWRFVRAYFLRLGFLDGYPGYYIAASTAFSTLLRYSRLYEARAQGSPVVTASPRK